MMVTLERVNALGLLVRGRMHEISLGRVPVVMCPGGPNPGLDEWSNRSADQREPGATLWGVPSAPSSHPASVEPGRRSEGDATLIRPALSGPVG